MRHFLLSAPVTALPLGVDVTTAQARLVTLPGHSNRSPSGLVGTLARTVAVTAITVATNQHGYSAAGA